MGFTVDTVADARCALSDATGKKFVYVSSTSTSGNIIDKFKKATCPVLMLEGKATDEMSMCPGNSAAYQDANQEQARPFVIADNGYLSSGFAIGDTIRWVTDTTTGGQVQLIAPFASATVGATFIKRTGDSPTSPYALLPAAWFSFEKGDQLVDGSAAAERRYWGPWCDANFTKLSGDGMKLWTAMINWACYIDKAPAFSGHVLLVGAAPWQANDLAVMSTLKFMGFTVDTVADARCASTDATGKKFLYVSSTSTSGNIIDKFKKATCPVLMLEGKATDEMSMCPGNSAAYQDANQEQARPFVMADNGYLASGFAIGDTIRWVTDTTTGGQVQLIAPFASATVGATYIKRTGDSPTSPYALLPAAWFSFEKGDQLVDGSAAADRRYWGPWCDANFTKLSGDGMRLWYAMINWAYGSDKLTSVEKTPGAVPVEFALDQNYPNPFNPSTMISFSIAAQTHVQLNVFNLIGQKVVSLVDERMNAGSYKVQFDANRLASGIYFYELRTDSKTMTKKMMLLR
jgi:hypothetical protein